jgi:putative hydrolase of the HAD superfamily
MLQWALFDLDDTLYPAQCGLWGAIGDRINRYMIERMGLSPEAVPALRHLYFETFGTTLNGLRHEHHIDAADYLAYVHDVPLASFLAPAPDLDAMLARLPLRKAVLTNADAAHARRVLAALGVERHFEAVVDVNALAFVTKPNLGAYQRALELLGAAPRACVFADDSLRNLLPARALGMVAVLVSARPLATAGVDLVIPAIAALEPALRAAGWLARAAAAEVA